MFFILHLFLKQLNAHQNGQIAIIQIKNNSLDIRAIGLDPAATSYSQLACLFLWVWHSLLLALYEVLILLMNVFHTLTINSLQIPET